MEHDNEEPQIIQNSSPKKPLNIEIYNDRKLMMPDDLQEFIENEEQE